MICSHKCIEQVCKDDVSIFAMTRSASAKRRRCEANRVSAHQSVVRVNATVGGALGGAMGGVPASQHAAVVTLLAEIAATAAAPGFAAVVTI